MSERVSAEVIDLICRLLVVDKFDRLPISAVLADPWMATYAPLAATTTTGGAAAGVTVVTAASVTDGKVTSFSAAASAGSVIFPSESAAVAGGGSCSSNGAVIESQPRLQSDQPHLESVFGSELQSSLDDKAESADI